MNVHLYLEALSMATGQDVHLSESGVAACTIDGHHVLLQWYEGQNSLLVHVDVDRLEHDESLEIFRRLLSANYMLAETNGSTLSYDAATGMVGLCRPVTLCCENPQDFVLGVRNMTILAQLWKERLVTWRQEFEEKAHVSSSPPQRFSVYSASANNERVRRIPFWQFKVFGMPRHQREALSGTNTQLPK